MDPRGHVYEDFEPPHCVVREPPTHTISVNLSAEGFKKDHIKVQLVHSHRRLIVRGERHVAGNRWRRFRLEFKLPDECDTKGIQARFEKGVVRVIMPGLKPVDAAGQQERASPAAKPADAAAAASGVQVGAERQDGGRPAPAPPADAGEEFEKNQKTKVQKQESGRQRLSSAKDGGGRDNDDDASEGGEAAAVAPSSRQGYALLHDRKKMATTVLGVVLVLISFGIYVRYSLAP